MQKKMMRTMSPAVQCSLSILPLFARK